MTSEFLTQKHVTVFEMSTIIKSSVWHIELEIPIGYVGSDDKLPVIH
jgi:hypothetical protein